MDIAESPEITKSWTYMLYLAGDNDLDEDWLFPALKRLQDMPTHPNVNVVIQYDRSEQSSKHYPGVTRYVYRIGKDNQVERLAFPLGERNTGDPQTLSNFIAWAHDTYPADHYYLAIANHGRGMAGLGWDDTPIRNFDWLNPTSLRNALRTATNGGTWQIDVLHLDACLMAQVEDAYQVKDYAHYLIASQNLGWSVFGYDQYVDLVPRVVSGTIAPRDLAIQIADRYFDDHGVKGKPRTISAMDLSQVVSLRQAVDGLAHALTLTLSAQPNLTATIEAVRDATQHFDSWGDGRIDPRDDEVVDLYDLAEKLQNNFANNSGIVSATQQVMDVISPTFVIYERHESGDFAGLDGVGNKITATWALSGSHGVGIYFPPAPGSYDYQRYAITRNLFLMNADGDWDDFLQTYFTVAEIPPIVNTPRTEEQSLPAIVPPVATPTEMPPPPQNRIYMPILRKEA